LLTYQAPKGFTDFRASLEAVAQGHGGGQGKQADDGTRNGWDGMLGMTVG